MQPFSVHGFPLFSYSKWGQFNKQKSDKTHLFNNQNTLVRGYRCVSIITCFSICWLLWAAHKNLGYIEKGFRSFHKFLRIDLSKSDESSHVAELFLQFSENTPYLTSFFLPRALYVCVCIFNKHTYTPILLYIKFPQKLKTKQSTKPDS